ncbi:MAG: GNAT family N-acetyltransferase [Clostridia bacterium]
MFSFNINAEDIVIKDIKRRDLPQILKWYNATEEYKYATGIDHPISLKDLFEKYLEVTYSKNEFFAGIYLKSSGMMIGILKGRVRNDEDNTAWINSLLIDKNYQGLGYGSKSLSAVSTFLKKGYQIDTIYISVLENNHKGIDFWKINEFEFVRKIVNHIMINGEAQDVMLMRKEIG